MRGLTNGYVSNTVELTLPIIDPVSLAQTWDLADFEMLRGGADVDVLHSVTIKRHDFTVRF